MARIVYLVCSVSFATTELYLSWMAPNASPPSEWPSYIGCLPNPHTPLPPLHVHILALGESSTSVVTPHGSYFRAVSIMPRLKERLLKLIPFRSRSTSPSPAVPTQTTSRDTTQIDTLGVEPSSSALLPVRSSRSIAQSDPPSPSENIIIHVPADVVHVHAQSEPDIVHQDLSPPSPSHANAGSPPLRTAQSVAKTVLRVGAPATEVFPPAKAIVSGIMEVLKVIDVCLYPSVSRR